MKASKFTDAQERELDCIVDPQSAEGDAARLSTFQPSPDMGVAGNVVVDAGVANHQLSPAPSAAHQPVACPSSDNLRPVAA